MPTLEWIGKEKVINHDKEVPFKLLDARYTFDANGKWVGVADSDNMIIHGDNLLALKALLPKYQGKIKCIYIDPPYNTGNEGWVYNDKVSDPQIKKWLGEVVGKEGEDLSRHDKWLCMMYPRLTLLKKLLSEDGFLIISIGYHELHNLLCVCKEIFANFQVVAVTVQTSGGKPSGGFNYVHEYLVFIVPIDFSANALELWGGNERTPFEGLTLSTFDKTQRPNQTYPIFVDNQTGSLAGVGLSLQQQLNKGLYTGNKEDFSYDYSVAPDGTVAVWPITAKGKECVWRQIPERVLSDWKKGYIKITRNKNQQTKNKYSVQYLPSGVIKKIESGELKIVGHEDGVPTLRFGENKTVGGQVPTIWDKKEFFTVNGTKLLKSIFPESDKVFDYPKSFELISAIISAATGDNDIILDSFAGSGTTAHAVLSLNKKDNGNRKFILVEMMDYAESITAERVRRVIDGYGEGDKAVPGTGGSFTFYELGENLFNDDGNLNAAVPAEKIREYVWYMETKRPLPVARRETENKLENETESAAANQNGNGDKTDRNIEQDNNAFLGVSNHTAYYFYYNPESVTTLDHEFLSTVKTKAESYVIYADACALGEGFLTKHHITFKKIPRDIERL